MEDVLNLRYERKLRLSFLLQEFSVHWSDAKT